MLRFDKKFSRVQTSLDIESIGASLSRAQIVMSRCKKKFIAWAGCLSVVLLSLGFFGRILEISPPLETTAHSASHNVQLVSVQEPTNDFAPASYDEATQDAFGAEYAGSDSQI